MNKTLLAIYGLKFNPFVPDIPDEALWHPPGHGQLSAAH